MAGVVKFTPTEDDFVNAQRDWYLRSLSQGRWLRSLVIGAGACGIVVALVWLLFESPLEAFVFGAGMALVVALVIPIMWTINYLLLPRRAGRLFRQQRSLNKEFQYEWSETGVEYRSHDGTGQILWSDLHRWSDGRRTVLLYLNDNLFHYLPRRLMTADQVEDLRATATALGPQHF